MQNKKCVTHWPALHTLTERRSSVQGFHFMNSAASKKAEKTLTAEQLERIAHSRALALERRKTFETLEEAEEVLKDEEEQVGERPPHGPGVFS